MPTTSRKALSKQTDPTSFSIIALDKFILATRDSGYKGTGSAVSELVDNAIQARAGVVAITVKSEGVEPNQAITVSVEDDGTGMDPFTLRQALRFGGSTRFNDRAGLGRYGMGLPNSSLSQARCVTVFTWQAPGAVYSSYLDVDEIASGQIAQVPPPRRSAPPPGARAASKSGTLVVWTQCDRLDNRRVATISRKLAAALGQTFRHFLWNGTKILINGEPVRPVDPLFVKRERGEPTAEPFGDPLEFEVRVAPDSDRTGKVRVTFTLLPIHALHGLTNEQKRDLGIAKGAGVSVVRAGREVDYGWFFMGAKRRENYDDWFRCEVEFDPMLDEAFGITHTKQQIRPQQYLSDVLTPDIERAAHALNGRIRKEHLSLQLEERLADSEKVAQKCEARLSPLVVKPTRTQSDVAAGLRRRHPSLSTQEGATADGLTFRIVEDERAADFFTHAFVDGQFVLAINPNHTFFKKVYRPLAESDEPRDRTLRGQLDLLLIAAARAEAALARKLSSRDIARFRQEWSDTLATYLTA
jgi:hypothetical protein